MLRRTAPQRRGPVIQPVEGAPAPDRTRSDDILRAHRLAHTGGSTALLRWLGTRLGGWTGVLDPDGDAVAAGDGPPAGPEAALAARGAAELTARRVRSAVLEGAGATALLFALDGAGVLAAVLPRPHPPAASTLLADAAVPLALVLRAERAAQRAERVDAAESRAREAVLHLLMNGRLSVARQVAEALTPALPDPLRMYVVECPVGRRAAVTRICEELTARRAWLVRCPVYVRHLIVLVPTDLAATSTDHDPLAEALVAVAPDCVAGVSEEVHLGQAPAAYTQAFHALAVARGRGERHARFGAGAPEPELAAHEAGAGWAAALLAPLHRYVPRRPQDPGAQELRATAHAWLGFASHATRLLKIHRNTLATRLRLVESVLGLDLDRLADQAALSLALRLTPGGAAAGPADPGTTAPSGAGPSTRAAGPGTLDDVLRAAGPAAWARRQLAPLTGPDAPPEAWETVRTWLRHDAQLAPTAAALGLSVPGARKRLTRIEVLLERSLLQSPSARHDLWLAYRAQELA
ncbi:helix-turn-helix domain-containing protein [Streptomyces sp. WAC06614]|uniref:helix-turn-helix domain-containing protein n=1 Tax=Streptomyces sp. WAC06614 TaxID=2487416 RepID=UPI000F768C68|nr:helix-turn-helix domain-containing protein [Streptomyces sp. WAC06614]RSS78153.1 PucR family transcriptional regulator [Streptomyces sp. WAC06614]